MKKRILGLALGAVLLMLPTEAVRAAGPVDGGTAQFTDKGMQSVFQDSGAVQREIGSLQPGGSVTIQVKLENQRKQNTDWYMTSQVVKSLEDSNDIAKGGAYTYELSYTNDATGDVKTLYSSQNVGGGERRTGLHEADEALDEYVYLDRLGAGGTGRVTLTVGLDAETLGNAYQSTLADLQMAFAAEIVSRGGGGSSSGGGSAPGNPGSPQASTVLALGGVQTGDASNLMLWSLIALLSGLILLVWAAILLRKGKGGRRS